jgi:hypothetical protein
MILFGQTLRPVIDNLRQAAGAHVLLSRDGGHGDSLQFIRYLPMLADVAGRVTLKMPRELHRLFAGIDNRVRIIANRDEAGSYDLECPAMQLPYVFRTELDTIPSAPYLRVPDAAIAARRLPDLSPGSNMRVGLCWAGGQSGELLQAIRDRKRSMSFDQIAPLLDVPGVDFYSLQLGPRQHSSLFQAAIDAVSCLTTLYGLPRHGGHHHAAGSGYYGRYFGLASGGSPRQTHVADELVRRMLAVAEGPR